MATTEDVRFLPGTLVARLFINVMLTEDAPDYMPTEKPHGPCYIIHVVCSRHVHAPSYCNTFA